MKFQRSNGEEVEVLKNEVVTTRAWFPLEDNSPMTALVVSKGEDVLTVIPIRGEKRDVDKALETAS